MNDQVLACAGCSPGASDLRVCPCGCPKVQRRASSGQRPRPLMREETDKRRNKIDFRRDLRSRYLIEQSLSEQRYLRLFAISPQVAGHPAVVIARARPAPLRRSRVGGAAAPPVTRELRNAPPPGATHGWPPVGSCWAAGVASPTSRRSSRRRPAAVPGGHPTAEALTRSTEG